MTVQALEQVMLSFSLILPRLFSCFIILPILGKQVLGGALVRNGVACSLALFIYPSVAETLPAGLDGLQLGLLIGKEVLIGLLLGFVVCIPFWALEACGFLIDNQRGATLASTLNPMLGSQTSPTGALLVQTLITLFFTGGACLGLLGALLGSYVSWPVASFYPQIGPQWSAFFLAQFDYLMTLCLLFAAPLLIAMFLAEFGLALISRFAPSLNVFILSMPVKSLVCSALLVPYLYLLMGQAQDQVFDALAAMRLLGPLLEQP
ncbi:type III secretion system export apparatus subunit SctT [Pseudomonas maumuensis]|uniref:Type III secretion system export apparatus subunit SctT n=1 Tax=Pseudomonas maumuensis TaxID=2842354 RepID=A0ABX8NRN2_9PSED|nr:type III secretion system export apparatus subunit SctT [Pseudomonas maumuensis]QXH58429.1 type III secretion system export apparatus subunit SctT [Pseudomonas maumuensis]